MCVGTEHLLMISYGVRAELRSRHEGQALDRSHLLEHKLSDVVSQLVLVQMRAPCVVGEMI